MADRDAEEMESRMESGEKGTSSDSSDIEMTSNNSDEEVDDKVLAEQKRAAGNDAYTSKEYSLAVELYTAAIELQKDCALYYGNRSAAYIMLKDYTKALDDANNAIRLEENYIKGYIRIAKCNLAQGSTELAEISLAKAKEIDPSNKTLLYEYSRVCQIQHFEALASEACEKKDYIEVLLCTRMLLELSPDCTLYKVMGAEALALLKRYSEAEIEADGILEENAKNADALYVKGMCLYYQGDIEQALTYLADTLKMDPDHKKAKLIRKKAKSLKLTKENGDEAYRNGNLQEAYYSYSKVLLIDPDNVSIRAMLYFNRGVIASMLNKPTETIDDCTEAITLDRIYLEAYIERANSYMQTEQYEEAVRDYETIVGMNGSREFRQLLQKAKLELEKSKRKDYYEVLSLPRNCLDVEIKKAYKREALEHHPDRHSRATEEKKKAEEMKFKEVNEAYSVLSNPQEKARYDSQYIDDNGFSTADFDPNTAFQGFFSGGGGGGQPYVRSRDFDPNTAFQGFFSGGGGGGQPYVRSRGSRFAGEPHSPFDY